MSNILVTIGDPAGIGPEVALKAAAVVESPVTLVGPESIWRRTADHLDLTISSDIVDVALPDGDIVPGTPGPVAATVALESLRAASDRALAGDAAAIATAPLAKSTIADLGIAFTGHTGWLAEQAGVSDPVMFFWSERMKVALITTHLPLAEAVRKVTSEKTEQVLRAVHHACTTTFGLSSPRIALCGLNPHAGEAGLLGSEDRDVLTPVVANLEDLGVSGPWPGDTVFRRMMAGEFDVVVACYHDQGLGPVKTVADPDVVNVTLGLPYIRTSPDHGTAFSKAGTGTADPTSMTAALNLAIQLTGK
jgi:4-hydroxythreonine-4-phosphate dehydrogenase